MSKKDSLPPIRWYYMFIRSDDIEKLTVLKDTLQKMDKSLSIDIAKTVDMEEFE